VKVSTFYQWIHDDTGQRSASTNPPARSLLNFQINATVTDGEQDRRHSVIERCHNDDAPVMVPIAGRVTPSRNADAAGKGFACFLKVRRRNP